MKNETTKKRVLSKRETARGRRSQSTATSGGCLCGAIRYEVRGPIAPMTHCHCSMCRREHGAAFATYAGVAARDLVFTRGEAELRCYRSSKNVDRGFCPTCGSSLLFLWLPLPRRAWIAAGTFDGDPGTRPDAHIFVRSKAEWFEIRDELAQFEEDRS